MEEAIKEILTENNVTTVKLSGKIDARNFEDIQIKVSSIVDNEPIDGLVFDMDEVTYVSSAGLRMFSAINQVTAEKGLSYKLTNMREDIIKMFQMTGYASAFCIEAKNE